MCYWVGSAERKSRLVLLGRISREEVKVSVTG